MLTPDEFCELALSLPETVQGSHHGTTDFRVDGKVFATLRSSDHRAVLKLTPGDQAMHAASTPAIVSPVDGAWGDKGWTRIALDQAEREAVRHLLATAWRTVAPKRVVRRHVL